MSIFENMNAKEIAMCLSAFYEAAKKNTQAQLYSTQVYLPDLGKPINMDRSDYDEGIKILRDDYEVFWTPDTKPDDLKWKINKRRMKELDALDCETVEDNVGALNKVRKLMAFKRDVSRLVGMGPSDGALAILEHLSDRIHSLDDVAKERDEADRLRRHWHAKYEDEHKECVRLSKLHAADKEKKNNQDTVIRNLRDNNTTLEYSVAALKKRIRSMDAEAAEKETKNKVITDTLRDNLVNSIEECKRLNGRIHDLESLIVNLTHDGEGDE